MDLGSRVSRKKEFVPPMTACIGTFALPASTAAVAEGASEGASASGKRPGPEGEGIEGGGGKRPASLRAEVNMAAGDGDGAEDEADFFVVG